MDRITLPWLTWLVFVLVLAVRSVIVTNSMESRYRLTADVTIEESVQERQ